MASLPLFSCFVAVLALSLYLRQGMMASGVLAGRDRAKLGDFVAAPLIRARAAGAEPAT